MKKTAIVNKNVTSCSAQTEQQEICIASALVKNQKSAIDLLSAGTADPKISIVCVILNLSLVALKPALTAPRGQTSAHAPLTLTLLLLVIVPNFAGMVLRRTSTVCAQTSPTAPTFSVQTENTEMPTATALKSLTHPCALLNSAGTEPRKISTACAPRNLTALLTTALTARIETGTVNALLLLLTPATEPSFAGMVRPKTHGACAPRNPTARLRNALTEN